MHASHKTVEFWSVIRNALIFNAKNMTPSPNPLCAINTWKDKSLSWSGMTSFCSHFVGSLMRLIWVPQILCAQCKLVDSFVKWCSPFFINTEPLGSHHTETNFSCPCTTLSNHGPGAPWSRQGCCISVYNLESLRLSMWCSLLITEPGIVARSPPKTQTSADVIWLAWVLLAVYFFLPNFSIGSLLCTELGLVYLFQSLVLGM